MRSDTDHRSVTLALINGKKVKYDLATTGYNCSYSGRPVRYLGKGVIAEVDGVAQIGKSEYHFWAFV